MNFAFAPRPTVAAPVLGGAPFPVHRIYCVGRNYVEHAKEMGFSGREPPFFFLKPADALVCVGPDATGSIDYPRLTAEFHHEVELVVAIGKGGADIVEADAAQHVFGYAVGLDMTRRDLQTEMKKAGRPWCIGKAFDQSAPLGLIAPVAATGALTAGAITLSVNGQERQRGDLRELIWNVAEIIVHLSRAWTLQPGDLIYTGTPAGVGAVVRGDLMRAHIEGLPPLRVAVH